MKKYSKKNNGAIYFFLLISILFIPTIGLCGNYWVSPTGIAEWASCSGSTPLSGSAACSLATANANAAAGDTIILRGGTYTDIGIVPSNTGTGSGTGRVIYQAYTGETPVLTGSISGIDIDNKSWIKVDGVTVRDTLYYLFAITNSSSHNEITNSTFFNSTRINNKWGYIGGMCQGGSGFTCPSTHTWFHNNIVHDVTIGDGCDDGYGLFQIGSANGPFIDVESNNNTVENNTLYHGGHHTIETNTRYNVIRNNISHNEGFRPYPVGGCNGVGYGLYDTDSLGHYPGNRKYAHRNFSIDSDRATNTYGLIEGNRIGYASANPANNGAEGISFTSTHFIFRYNAVFGSDGNAIYFKNEELTHNLHIYNNTIFGNGQYNGSYWPASTPMQTIPIFIGLGSYGHEFKNNLMYQNGTIDFGCGGTGCNPYTQIDIVNNWCYAIDGTRCTKSGDPKFVSTPTVDDTVISSIATLPNLNLQLSSSAIDAGTYLTTANGTGINSTSLIVADAMYFQDGSWGADMTHGVTLFPDWIAIGTVKNVVQISSINYTTNTITLASPMTWANGAPIWLHKKSDGSQVLYGSAPDMGAYEYGSESITAPKDFKAQP